MAGGEVRCWGLNSPGLGDGTSLQSASPVALQGVADATDVSIGNSYACVVAKGVVSCWGTNANGQLGDTTTDAHAVPVPAIGVSGASSVAAGHGGHTCALLTDRTVRCWGTNSVGQVGDGSTSNAVTTPVAAAGISDVVAIATGGGATCAVLGDGSMSCWGQGFNGGVSSKTPAVVPGVDDATAVAVGDTFGCVLRSNGRVSCLGDNTYGQLGQAAQGDAKYVPFSTTLVEVAGITDATAIRADYGHTCVLRSTGGVACWGRNYEGEIGGGTLAPAFTPVDVIGVQGATEISVGAFHTCAIVGGGGVLCWGSNYGYALGNQSGQGSLTPVPVTGL